MKSIKCHSAVLMIKDIFTKVVLQAMRMDIMTYKTEIKKNHNVTPHTSATSIVYFMYPRHCYSWMTFKIFYNSQSTPVKPYK